MKKSILAILISVAVALASLSGAVLVADWSPPATTQHAAMPARSSALIIVEHDEAAAAIPSAPMMLAPLLLGLFGLLVKPN